MALTIEEIKKLDAERTQGEWDADTFPRDDGIVIGCGGSGMEYHLVYSSGACSKNDPDWDHQWKNAQFIAAAPQITKQYIELYEDYNELYEKYMELKQEEQPAA